MNRFMVKFFAILVAAFIFSPGQSFAAQETQVYIDGDQMVNYSINPIQFKAITFVEARPTLEKLGYKLTWDEKNQIVTAQKTDLKVVMQVGMDTALVNGVMRKLALSPRVIKGHTLIPLRFVGEATGKHVNWDGKTNSIYIDTLEYSVSRYIVKAGDSIYSIARNFGIGVDNIMDANSHLDDPNRVDAGQFLNIPNG